MGEGGGPPERAARARPAGTSGGAAARGPGGGAGAAATLLPDAAELVREATRPTRAGPLDLALGLQVCELINAGGEAEVRAAATAMQRLLKSKYASQVRLDLELIDLALGQCKPGLVAAVASRAFLQTYMNMVNNIRFVHTSHLGEAWLEVYDLALGYAKAWAARFAAQHAAYPHFQALYRHIQSQPDMRTAPSYARPRAAAAAESGPSAADAGADAGAAEPAGDPGRDEVLAFLQDVGQKTKFLHGMIMDAQAQVGKAYQLQITAHSELIQDLCGWCHVARGRLAELVHAALGEGAGPGPAAALDGETVAETLALLDLVDVLLPQCGWQDGRPPGGRPFPAPAAGSPLTVDVGGPGPETPAVTPDRSPAGLARSQSSPSGRRRGDSPKTAAADLALCSAIVDRKMAEVAVTCLNPPRPGKPLLVLDLDNTLADFKELTVEEPAPAIRGVGDLKRPFLDAFLAQVYPLFDLAIWSRSTWAALEIKLNEMGHFDTEDFRYVFVLDREATVEVPLGAPEDPAYKFVKPLRLIWEAEPLGGAYGPHNTIHVDDLPRNFALNPQNGLTIQFWQYVDPTKDPAGHARSVKDRELEYLLRYLRDLAAGAADWTGRDHSRWRQDVMMQAAEERLAEEEREKQAREEAPGPS